MNSKWISLACLLAAAVPNPGQPQSSPTPDNNIRFEVASVRPSGQARGATWSMEGNPFLFTHIRPIKLIMMAYFPPALQFSGRIQNCPPDLCDQQYDIRANAPEDLLPRLHGPEHEALTEQMLQGLLKDRFSFSSHIVPVESNGFALVIGKQGSQLKPAPEGQVRPMNGWPLHHGGFVVTSGDVSTFYGATVASLMDVLGPGVHTIIEDHTGLTGHYNFTLVRQPDFQSTSMDEVTRPELIWKLNQLGLRVEPIKVKINTIVIDHIEAPSPN